MLRSFVGSLCLLAATLQARGAPWHGIRCPHGGPGVVLTVQVSAGDKGGVGLLTPLPSPGNLTHYLAVELLGKAPARVSERHASEALPEGKFLLVAEAAVDEAGSSLRLLLAEEVPDSRQVVHLELVTCNASAVVAGPEAAYAQAMSARAILAGARMRWSARALQLQGGWQEDLEEDFCPTNLQSIGEYFEMMSDLEEDKELVASRQTAFSAARIWRFGNHFRLLLDGVVMSDSRDEHIYHEMLVHPALRAVRSHPRHVLIVGGGEGATLREVLRDPRVVNVTMVEIDEGLVHLCREHLASMHRGSFDSPKVGIIFDDGAAFLHRAQAASFDAIIVDGVDFQDGGSYGNVLFSRGFYQDAFRALREGGVFVQYMSRVDRAWLMTAVGFDETVSLGVDVPSFYGAGARFTLAGKSSMGPLADRLLQRAMQEEDGLHGLQYLDSRVLVQALQHKGRRLKGGAGGSWGSSGGGIHRHAGDCSGLCRRSFLGPVGFGTALAFAGTLVILHNRRRRGVYYSDPDGCTVAPEFTSADGSNSSESGALADGSHEAVGKLCENTIGVEMLNGGQSTTLPGANALASGPGSPVEADGLARTLTSANDVWNASCRACEDCTTEACIATVPGCDNYLANLYTGCAFYEEDTDKAASLAVGLTVVGLLLSVMCCCCWLKRKKEQAARQAAEDRGQFMPPGSPQE